MAIKYWQPTAAALNEVKTITVANTWATSDTATITINGNDLVLTVGAVATTAGVAAALAAAFNGDAVIGTETRNTTGNLIPEFFEIGALAVGSTVVLTHKTGGVPFTATVSESTAGSGTLAIADTVSAWGPSFVDCPDNWSGGSLPADNDTIVIDGTSVGIKYCRTANLATIAAITPAAIYVRAGFTGDIGLPQRNANGYQEYRPTYLSMGDVADVGTVAQTLIYIGQGDGAGSRRIKLDTNDQKTLVTVYSTGTPAEQNVPAFLFIGTHADNEATINKGSVGFASLGNEIASGTCVLSVLRVGYTTNPTGDSDVVCGQGCSLTTIEQAGGSLEVNAAATTITKTGGELHLRGNSVTVTTLNERGGTTYVEGTTTITTANVSNAAELNYARDMRAKVITNPVNLYGDKAKFKDPSKVTGSVVIDCEQSGNLANIDLGQHVKITRGTPT